MGKGKIITQKRWWQRIYVILHNTSRTVAICNRSHTHVERVYPSRHFDFVGLSNIQGLNRMEKKIIMLK